MNQQHRIREALAKLIDDHQERGTPFVFGGRRKIIQDILRVAKNSLGGSHRGQTFLITGAPGAGKTSLLEQVKKEWESEMGPNRCVFLDSVPDHDENLGFWAELTSALTDIPLSKLTRNKQKQSRFGGSLGIFKGGIASTESQESRIPTSCRRIVRMAKTPLKHPVIVGIDEVQGIQESSDAINTIKKLHTQSDAPVLLICAGLSNSAERLYQAGLSQRMTESHVFRLGRLTKKETRKVVNGGLGVIEETADFNRNDLIDLLGDDITKGCDRWPHHLTCYFLATCQHLCSLHVIDLKYIDPKTVITKGDELRRVYYNRRIQASRLSMDIVGEFYEALQQGHIHTKEECDDYLRRLVQRNQRLGSEAVRRDTQNGANAFEMALKAGVVSYNDENKCEIPIPSMRKHVRKRVQSQSGQGTPSLRRE